MKEKDENDRHREGTLSSDPLHDTEPMTTPGESGTTNLETRWQKLTFETLDKEPPERKWLLRGVLPLGKVGMLAAEGGAGKTMALCQLALSVATGKAWLGAWSVAPEGVGKVLIVLGEEDAEEANRRMYYAARSMKLNDAEKKQAAERIETITLAGVPCAMLETDRDTNSQRDSEFAEWLTKKAKQAEGLTLAILDPLSRFAGIDSEKDNAMATRFVQAAEAVAVATRATVLVAHHTNQSARGEQKGEPGATVARGVTGLTDGMRWVAAMTVEKLDMPDDDVRERLGRIAMISVAKSNYARIPDAFSVRYDGANNGALLALDGQDRAFVDKARGEQKPGDDGAVRAKKADTAAQNARVKENTAELSARKAAEAKRMAPFKSAEKAEKDAEKAERRAKGKVSDCDRELAKLTKDKTTPLEKIAEKKTELDTLKDALATASGDFEKATKARQRAMPRIEVGSGDDD